MSTTTPIIPPGSPLQRQGPPPNSRFFVTVCAIVAVHVVLLAGLLIQGCKREDRNAAANELTTNPEPGFSAVLPPTNALENTARSVTAPPPVATNASVPGQPTSATPPVSVPTNAMSGAEPLTNPLGGVATPAVTEANAPRVAPPPSITSENPVVYTVKQGDTLTKIARTHGTTVRALRAVNALKTDRILVGQKLKIPVKGAPEAPGRAGETNSPAGK